MNRLRPLVNRLTTVIVLSAVVAACSSGDGGTAESGTNPPSTESVSSDESSVAADGPLTGAAAVAQEIIDAGVDPASCPVDIGYISAIMSKSVPLSSVFNGSIRDEGQLFTDGDVDLVYCWVRVDNGGTEANPGELVDMRIDVHPGTADVETYLDEQWGPISDLTSETVDGATITSGCVDDTTCVAMWQDTDLFIALMIAARSGATADVAVTGLEITAPLVVDNLVNGF